MKGLGIDLGSRKVKMAGLEGRDVLWTKEFDTIPFYKRFGTLDHNRLVLDFSAMDILDQDELADYALVTTGYGRNTINLASGRMISEIKAHVTGAQLQTGLETFTLLDLGGQDSKVARVEQGTLVDFNMNDKCAASSGRYLENMATVLEISLDELARHWEDPVDLAATCGIFGESELIGKIVEGHPLERLCAGVNYTLIKRVAPMLRHFPEDTIVLTGGVAKNSAFRKLLENESAATLVLPEHPQLNGALGCAWLAQSAN